MSSDHRVATSGPLPQTGDPSLTPAAVSALFASHDPVEVVAPALPATDAIRSFHHRHPQFEVRCGCGRPIADCPSPWKCDQEQASAARLRWKPGALAAALNEYLDSISVLPSSFSWWRS